MILGRWPGCYELRKSLEAANKALKRFSAETAAARGADLSAVDPAALRVARSQLHQVVGALDMVGFHAPALVVGAMEVAVQRFLSRPASCTEVTGKIERLASHWLITWSPCST